MKLLLYCTYEKPYLTFNKKFILRDGKRNKRWDWNGSIIAECDYEVEEINAIPYDEDMIYETKTLDYDDLLKKSCLNNQELDDYLQGREGYAIHIKNLRIYGFQRTTKYLSCVEKPRTMTYVYACFTLSDRLSKGKDHRYDVIVPMNAKQIVKILNREQTIIVKKKILKRMLNNETQKN